MMKHLFLLTLLIFVSYLYAGTTGSGLVNRIYPSSGSTVYFNLKNDACKTGNYTYYYFDGNTESGKAFYALLLTAANEGRTVVVEMTVECISDQNQEISNLYIEY